MWRRSSAAFNRRFVTVDRDGATLAERSMLGWLV